jgi:hypothetical protein
MVLWWRYGGAMQVYGGAVLVYDKILEVLC